LNQNVDDAGSHKSKNKSIVLKLLGVAVFMFGFGYALVPLYNVMCKQLGINGKTDLSVRYEPNTASIDKNRTITLELLANNNENLKWEFHPNIRKLKFHPGEMERISFYAKNKSDHTMTVQAIPSITPGVAAKYLKKTECFCFTQQTMKSQEEMDMPILFHIDPDLPKDIRTITLSYTLFDVTERFSKKRNKT